MISFKRFLLESSGNVTKGWIHPDTGKLHLLNKMDMHQNWAQKHIPNPEKKETMTNALQRGYVRVDHIKNGGMNDISLNYHADHAKAPINAFNYADKYKRASLYIDKHSSNRVKSQSFEPHQREDADNYILSK